MRFYSAHKENQFMGLVFLFLAILFFLYVLYLRIIRQAVLMTKIPLELEPIPPKYLQIWWGFTFFVWDWFGDIFFWLGKTTGFVIRRTKAYKITKSVISGFGLLAGMLAGAASTEIWFYCYYAIYTLLSSSTDKNIVFLIEVIIAITKQQQL